jgi:polyphosphate kinase
VAFPILDKKLKQRVIDEGLMILLADQKQTWLMLPDGSYVRRVSKSRQAKAAQELLLRRLAQSA